MFKAITPKFINQLDSFLLVNHPVLWMSKIHYAIWHGAVLWIISAILGYVIPINLKGNAEYELWYFLFTVIGIVFLCFWIFRFLIFNKEKNYGSVNFADEYKSFILVFAAVGIFLLVPAPFEVVYSQRIANMYTDKEVLQDINTVNERDPYLANSTNNYYSWYDSTTKIQYLTVRQLNPYGSNYYTPYYMRSDSAKYPQILTEFQLYKKYKPISDLDILTKKITEFINVADKYDCPVEETAEQLAKKYMALLARDKIPTSEFYGYGNHQYQLTSTFNNLCEAKFKPLFIFTSAYLWVMFYFIIGITSFLLLFKQTYWQQFLIMLVVLLLYPLIMFIISQMVRFNDFMRDMGFYEISLILLIVFSGITLFITALKHKRFAPVYNIFNQIFYITLIYSPLLVLVFIHDNTNIFHKFDHLGNPNYYESANIKNPATFNSYMYNYDYMYWAAEYERWITYIKYTDIILFVGALPFFKALFVKQLALPKKQ